MTPVVVITLGDVVATAVVGVWIVIGIFIAVVEWRKGRK